MTTTPHATGEDAVRKVLLTDEVVEAALSEYWDLITPRSWPEPQRVGMRKAILVALSRAPPLSLPHSGEPVKWPNGCDDTIPEALRFLADHERPAGGQQRFNSEHLYQLAEEIEVMTSIPLYAPPPATQIDGVDALLKQIDYALRKDSFCDAEKVESARQLVTRALAAPKPQRAVAREVIERCAKVADEHRKRPPANVRGVDQETKDIIRAEERGEDIACDVIAKMIRALFPTERHEGKEAWSLAEIQMAADSVVQRVCEYDDRTSPEDFPEALLITSSELHAELVRFAEDIGALTPTPDSGKGGRE